MSIIHLRQIADRLNGDFASHIDLTDAGATASGASGVVLSRSLAAFALSILAEVEPNTAASAVTDGFQDNGIDAIWYDRAEKTLYLVQSKWNENDGASISRGDVQLFIQGVKDLLASKKDRFNKRIQERWTEIDLAIGELRRLELVIAYSGSGSFGTEPQQDVAAYVGELNDTGEIAYLRILRQADLYRYLTAGSASAPINLDINIFDFGQTRDSIKAFYGQVAASDVAEWYKAHGHKIFAKNIRMFLGDKTQVNEQIGKTVREEPQHFWYLNNGITALADSLEKRGVGGSSKQSGIFECRGFSIVNGAQTVGSIFSAYQSHPEAVRSARVSLRIVSLEEAPEGFALAITKANNTQNRIDSQNFVALDPEQDRIQRELGIDGVVYEFRQSDAESSGAKWLGLQEATVALACTSADVDLATEAKRELGKLWEDISRPPYKLLFNSGLTGRELWSRVEVMRRIHAGQQVLALVSSGRSGHMLTHGNRFLAWLVYRRLYEKTGDPQVSSVGDAQLKAALGNALELTAKLIDQLYPDSYVANIFKNRTKCREIAGKIPSL